MPLLLLHSRSTVTILKVMLAFSTERIEDAVVHTNRSLMSVKEGRTLAP